MQADHEHCQVIWPSMRRHVEYERLGSQHKSSWGSLGNITQESFGRAQSTIAYGTTRHVGLVGRPSNIDDGLPEPHVEQWPCIVVSCVLGLCFFEEQHGGLQISCIVIMSWHGSAQKYETSKMSNTWLEGQNH